MIQTFVAAILLFADAVLIQFNMSALEAQLSVAGPGLPGAAVTVALLMAAAGGAVALVWLAGWADHALIRRRLGRRDAAFHQLSEELLRMKASAYDSQEPPLVALRSRLDALDQKVRALRAHVDEALIAERSGRRGAAVTVPAGAARDPAAAPWT